MDRGKKMVKKIKNIEIIESLSRGGMGEIYKGYHEDLEKYVVLKKILIPSEDANVRFKNEAKILIDLHHENIVPVFDYFQARNNYFILMDYIDGLTLRSIIEEKGFLPENIILLILYQILKGFDYFHKKGVIHRDIKPENIILSKDGVLKIVDFGIAFGEEKTENITKAGFIIGTPKYIAPEIYKGEKASVHSDIYSLGVVLYELITGTSPFDNLEYDKTVKLKISGKIASPKTIRKGISNFLNNLTKKMLHKNPKKRGTAEILLKKIEKRLSKLDLKNNEEILKNYFFLETADDNATIQVGQQTITANQTVLDQKNVIKSMRILPSY